MGEHHAEVAGAGLVGLTVATLLARSGWSVRVHERSTELREVGAGLFLWRNALNALEEACGVASIADAAQALTTWERFDERDRRIFHRTMDAPETIDGATRGPLVIKRVDLHRTLAETAVEAGVEIVLGSEVAGADAKGVLRLTDGTMHHADLVVGADGVNSTVRGALGVKPVIAKLGSGGWRFLVARRADEPPTRAYEHKNGARSIGVVPCKDSLYIYLECRADDNPGRSSPLNRATWQQTFPGLGVVLDRLDPVGRWSEFVRVRCKPWSDGKVVLLGDAAHAMPPHLGQGACLGMSNAHSLVHALGRSDVTPTALAAWEEAERPVTDVTQRWATIYARMGTQWPRALLGLRSATLRAADRSRYVRAWTGRAAGHESRFVVAGSPPKAQ